MAFIPRFAYLSYFLTRHASYPFGNDNYFRLSQFFLDAFKTGKVSQADTYYEPFYPFFLAVARFLAADQYGIVMALQIAVAALGAVYLYRLSVELSKNSNVGWIAAALYSFYPYAIRQSVSVMEVTLLSTLLIIGSYTFIRIKDGRSAFRCGSSSIRRTPTRKRR